MWDERIAGTTSIGTSLAVGRAVNIAYTAHICRGWESVAGVVALIYHPVSGSIVGVCNLAGASPPMSKATDLLTRIACDVQASLHAQYLDTWVRLNTLLDRQRQTRISRPLLFDRWGHPDPNLRQNDSPLALGYGSRLSRLAQQASSHFRDSRDEELEIALEFETLSFATHWAPIWDSGTAIGVSGTIIPSNQEDLIPPRTPETPSCLFTGGSGTDTQIVRCDEVSRVVVKGSGVHLITERGEFLSSYNRLSDISPELPRQFYLVNRSEIVNVEFFHGVEYHGNMMILIMKDGENTCVEVSRRRVQGLRVLIHL